MWTRSLKCSLVLFACVFLSRSGSVSAGTRDGAGTSALSNTGALQDAEDIPGAHDKQKAIRSYGSTGFPHDNNANRGVKSHGTPSVHGAGHDHGYNKNGDDCSKCKWENDSYWERDEPEEEGDEHDGDECDDGQYRPDKTHRHGPGTGHRPGGSRPSEVHKIGPTGVYGVDDEVPRGGSTEGPRVIHDHTIPYNILTPKPGSVNTPFALKPGYNDATAGALATTPSSWPDLNRGTTPGSFSSTPKPAWAGGHDGRFPSSQAPSSWPDLNRGTTPGSFSSTPKPAWALKPGYNDATAGAFATTPSSWPNLNRRTTPGSFRSTPTPGIGHRPGESHPSGVHDGDDCDDGQYRPDDHGPGTGHGPGGSHPSEVHKIGPTGVYGVDEGGPRDGSTESSLHVHHPTESTNSFNYNILTPKPGSVNAPFPDASKPATAGAFATTPSSRPDLSRGTPGSFSTTPKPAWAGGHDGRFPSSPAPGASVPNVGATSRPGQGWNQIPRGSSTPVPHAGSGVPSPSSYENPQENQQPYGQPGTQNAFSGAGAYAGASAHAGAGAVSGIASPYEGSNYGRRVPNPTFSPYDGTGQTQPGFNVAGSGAIANANAGAFATSPGAYNTPGITPSIHGTTPPHRGGLNHPPGVGNIRPAHGTVPHGTHPGIGGTTWPGGQPGGTTVPWPNGNPADGSGITPGRYPPGASGAHGPGRQPQGGSGTWPVQVQPGQVQPGYVQPGHVQPGHVQPGYVQPGYVQPGYVQPTHGSGPGCDRSCGGATSPQGSGNCGSVGCCGNCNGGCSGNVPAHGACGGVYPKEVNKTFYPAGTGDGNVPNIGIYGPDPNLNTGVVHPGIPGSVTPQRPRPRPMNPANPFLPGYQPGAVIPNNAPRPWTTKPIGKGNIFLDANARYTPTQPAYNVIPHGNTKQYIGQGNLFLDRNANPGGVVPPRRKIPQRNNPFLRPLDGSDTPLYRPDGSGTSGNYPVSGMPENYPGPGTPGNYPDPGTSGNYPGPGPSENYPDPGTSGNYPDPGTSGNYPASGPSEIYPDTGMPENYPGARRPTGNYPAPESGSYAGVGGAVHPGGAPAQVGNSGRPYPAGSNPQGNRPGGIGRPANSGIGVVPGAGYPGSGVSNLAAPVGAGQARSYSGSYSSAQAASSSFSGSYSGTSGLANNYDQNLSPGAQNQDGSWASSGAYASSNAGSWSGNRPISVKG